MILQSTVTHSFLCSIFCEQRVFAFDFTPTSTRLKEFMKNDMLIQIIKDNFQKLSNKNKRFSKRSYAPKIGLSSGALTDFLSGKRGISQKKAKEVLDKLGYSEAEQVNILKFNPLVHNKVTRSFKKIEKEAFDTLLSWEHLAILSLTKTTGFNSSPEWIAKKLSLEIEIIEQALVNLETHKLIKREGTQFTVTAEDVETFDHIPSDAIKKSHRQDFEIHKKNLEDISVELRDMSSITLAFDVKKIDMVKSAIRLFQEQIAEIAETSDATEVYKLSVYLGPLSKLA